MYHFDYLELQSKRKIRQMYTKHTATTNPGGKPEQEQTEQFKYLL